MTVRYNGDARLSCPWPDAPSHQFFRRRSRLVRHHLAELLREGVRAGELLPDIDPDARAREVLAFMEGAHLQWLLDPDEIDLVALYRTYVEGLIAQLAAPLACGPRAADSGVEP